MTGVNILAEVPIEVFTGWCVLSIFLICIAIACFTTGFQESSIGCHVVGLIFAIISTIVFLSVGSEEKTGYQAMITEEASYLEFTEKYSVYSKEGEIYILELKEND